MTTTPPIRLGMVGGGSGAFIGAVHRAAARLDGHYSLVAGALSSSPDRALASGRELGLDPSRTYRSWLEMADLEAGLPRHERIQAVSIVTPNDSHHPIARAFLERGFNVVLDKPMVHTSGQAEDLWRLARKHDCILAVTYNYSGYPMVRQARELVRTGMLGAIRKVIVEYNQGWLATALERTGQKQADWRTDPARAGLGGAIGDIGSHAEQLVSCITGLTLESICADLSTYVEGRRLDDDANILLRFEGGAKGILTCSQVCIGCENDLRIRVWGETGGLEWRQEEPNHLAFRPRGAPEVVYRRGNDYLADAAKGVSRLPSGHPEAFIEAFATIYTSVAAAIRAGGGFASGKSYDFPDASDGARGVHFIESAVRSAASSDKWTDARWTPPA